MPMPATRASETDFGDGVPAIAGNAVQLQQVVLNLTRNAVDAMRGAVGRPKTLLIQTVRSGPGHVQIRVSDHGPGISSRLADAIFHPFFTTKKDGLGVGLAISRTIVEAHGGKLGFEGRPGGGTTFTVTLPLLQDND